MSASALDPFDPSWLGRPVRAGLALVDALQLAGPSLPPFRSIDPLTGSGLICMHSINPGALLGLGLFARARRLPWAHWKGLPGKARPMIIYIYIYITNI